MLPCMYDSFWLVHGNVEFFFFRRFDLQMGESSAAECLPELLPLEYKNMTVWAMLAAMHPWAVNVLCASLLCDICCCVLTLFTSSA